jgi:hypothetical protein
VHYQTIHKFSILIAINCEASNQKPLIGPSVWLPQIYLTMNNHNKQWRRPLQYANVVQTYLSRNSKPPDVQDPNDDEIDNPNTVKPIFLQDQHIFGSVKVTKPMWVTHVEIYKTIGAVVDPAAIKGI